MTALEEISLAVENGQHKLIAGLIDKAVEDGYSAKQILDDGLLAGMTVIGDKFTKNEVFIPEVLIAARAMNKGTEKIKPLLDDGSNEVAGKAVIGTVEGDMHDIGKNLVKLMLESRKFEVEDLGSDVKSETFVEAAIENDADIILCSALLSSTMPRMKEVIDLCEEKGIRDKVKIMVGGAPVNAQFAEEIGADAYTEDANEAAVKALQLMGK